MEFIFAGFGGQGIMAMGMLLAYAAINENYQSSFLPSYGPEMRGGTANCSVVIDRGTIASPLVTVPDVLVAMNYPSLIKFKDTVKENGLIFINSSLITRVPEDLKGQVYLIPINELAQKVGEPKTANMVMLGAVLNKINTIKLESAKKHLKFIFKNKIKAITLNEKALEVGYSYTFDKASLLCI